MSTPPYDPATAARFWSHVVKGPNERDCWIWTGAISDDGYGRFWLGAEHRPRVMRPSRYVYELVTGERLTSAQVVEHETCDNPICVRFAGEPGDHLLKSTQAANLARMGERQRGGGHWMAYRFRSSDRASLAARSRRLRDAVKDGWDVERIRAALLDDPVQQPPLFY